MFNVVITAGGTSENIDGVRKITNLSTGALGTYILQNLLDSAFYYRLENFKIYYILNKTARRKKLSPKELEYVEFVETTDCESVYKAVNNITKQVKVDLFIHSMAVSDFTYDYSISVDLLINDICRLQKSGDFSADKVRSLLENPKNKINSDTKISSDNDIIMKLKRTPKVISLIKKNNPETFLVGFKLLTNADENELKKSAQKLILNNGCDLVLANEASNISDENHKGLLIKNNEIIARATGKNSIAKMIVNCVFDELVNRNII